MGVTMAGNSVNTFLQYLRKVGGADEPGDAELLERFTTERDEQAFTLLVCRHGPNVYRLCRRMVQIEEDAEDVFQAAFLVLARKAGSIGKRESLGSWLHKVAFRIACRVRGKTVPLTNLPDPVNELTTTETESEVVWRDVRLILDEELASLPDSQRRAIILCYLEGKTHREAARLLGCPKGTLAARLVRAREHLCRRLTRRGLTLSVTGLGVALAEGACDRPIPAGMIQTTARAAVAFVSGQVHCARASNLAEGVLQMKWFTKFKFTVLLILALVLAGSAVAFAMRTTAKNENAQTKERPQKVPQRDPGPPKLKAWRFIEVDRQAENLTFAPDASFFLATVNNQVRIWNTKDLTEVTKYRCPIDWPERVILSADSGQAAAFRGQELMVWDVQKGTVLTKIKYEDRFFSACFSPDGKFLLTGNATFVNPQVNYIKSAVNLWEISSGKLVRTFASVPRPAKAVAFAPNGNILACTTGVLTRWDDDSGRIISMHRFDKTAFEYPTFSSDGERCLVPTSRSFGVWRTSDGKKIAQFADHPVHVRWIDTSNGCRFIISGCSSNNIGRVWDPENKKQGMELLGHSDYLVGAVISPDARLAVTSSRDRTIRVYRLK